MAMPYLATAGLALLLRRHRAALIVLLVAFLLSAGGGLSLLGNMAARQAEADEQVKNAMQPGEDPSRGAAAMRKSGAEMGPSISSVISTMLAMFVPPTQLAFVVLPTGVVAAVSALRKRAGDLSTPTGLPGRVSGVG